MPHTDIRIGTLVKMDGAGRYIQQILPNGFESFALTLWEKIGAVDLEHTARQVAAAIGDKAVISSVGLYGNPLQNETTARDFATLIDQAHRFKTNLVCGFAGALDGRRVDEALPRFKDVWRDLVKRAEDRGVRIAWENCDMGGTWDHAQWNIAHSPAAWEMMFNEIPSPAAGLEWEPCHQMVSLIDPLPQLRQWVGRVLHVHGKDATIAWDVLKTQGLRGGKPWVWHRTPGFGDTNWTDLITILRQAKWTGAIDIEGWHDPVYRDALEMTGQVHGLNYLKHCRGGAFVPNPS